MDDFDIYMQKIFDANFASIPGSGTVTVAEATEDATAKVADLNKGKIFIVTELYLNSSPDILTVDFDIDGIEKWTGTTNRFVGRSVKISPMLPMTGSYKLTFTNDTAGSVDYEYDLNGFWISKEDWDRVKDEIIDLYQGKLELEIIDKLAYNNNLLEDIKLILWLMLPEDKRALVSKPLMPPPKECYPENESG